MGRVVTGPLFDLRALARALAELPEEELRPLRERLATRESVSQAGESPYLTIPEAAAFLRTTRARIDNLLSEGSLTRVKEGGRTLLRRAEVEARARPEKGPAR